MSATSPSVRPLSSTQERKLLDFIDDRFLDLTRNYKKRSDPSSTVQTLSAYLSKTHPLLSLVLQIPPVPPSAPLRTTLLLRLTGEVMQSITGYHPDVETLPQLLDWLNELDRGWLAVLRSQAWDSDMHTGTTNAAPDQTIASMSQTERTRLRSLLISGTGSLEEWLLRLDAPAGQSYEFILESLGLQQAFDELFTGTLAEMGSLDGSMNVPQGMVGTC